MRLFDNPLLNYVFSGMLRGLAIGGIGIAVAMLAPAFSYQILLGAFAVAFADALVQMMRYRAAQVSSA